MSWQRLIRPGCPLYRTLPRAGQLCVRLLIRGSENPVGGCGDTRLMQIMAIFSK